MNAAELERELERADAEGSEPLYLKIIAHALMELLGYEEGRSM